MSKNGQNHSKASIRPNFAAISKLQMFMRKLRRTFEAMADATDETYDNHFEHRVAALEQRVAVLEKQKVSSQQN